MTTTLPTPQVVVRINEIIDAEYLETRLIRSLLLSKWFSHRSIQYRIAIRIIIKCRSVWHLFCSFGLQWPFPKASFCSEFPPDQSWTFSDLCSRSLYLVFEWPHLCCRWLTVASAFLSRIIEQLSFQCPTSKLESNKGAIHVWATCWDGFLPILSSLPLSLFVSLSSLQCLCPIKRPERQPHQYFQSSILHVKDNDYFLQHNNKIFHSLILTDPWSLSANCIFWYFNLSLLQTLFPGLYYLLFITIV